MIGTFLKKTLFNVSKPPLEYMIVSYNGVHYAIARDSSNILSYSLSGLYTYSQVEQLNALTGFVSKYGYNHEKGPIAFIGLPEKESVSDFFLEVTSYGEITPYEEFDFEEYSEKNAQGIGNFTVYGLNCIQKIADCVHFDKIDSIFDTRRQEAVFCHDKRVLKMKCKLEGYLNFKDVQFLTKYQYEWAIDRYVSYAVLENGEYVAILGFNYNQKDEAIRF